MSPQHDPAVLEALTRLKPLDERFLEIGHKMVSADNGNLYGMDLFAVGAIKRAVALVAGFRLMVERRNFVCAGALLRIHVDTALRFFATFIVKDPHKFALEVLGGTRIDKLVDANGNRLSDRYLVERLSRDYPWLPNVYERTSGYVHFSSTHFLGALVDADDGTRAISMFVSGEDNAIPKDLYIEAINAFVAASDILLKYLEGWVFTKNNPEYVSGLKTKLDQKSGDA